MGSRKQFTPEFKREAVQFPESGSRPASEIARFNRHLEQQTGQHRTESTSSSISNSWAHSQDLGKASRRK
jgi:hypothetical protein